MKTCRVAVVGAGIGGLTAALTLAAAGAQVIVLERAAAPGGKLREIATGGVRIDAGPTVFTMRHVFDDLFSEAGESFDDHVALRPLDVLARHAWSEDARLDLFADEDRTVEAIGAFAGPDEGRRYRTFCADTRRIYATLERPFMRAPKPSLLGLIANAGLRGIGDLLAIKPFATMWRALGSYFHDPRLRQLFGRYATYCGSSPFLSPATLMLIAHVERDGVWSVDGGMHGIATALARLAQAKGAVIRYGSHVQEVAASGGRVGGVILAGSERIEADAVIVNADAAAVANGLLGRDIAPAIPRTGRTRRSLSAVTWTLAARTQGFPLLRHNVFFSGDYAAEFDDLFGRGRLPQNPTVYVCAQDRESPDGSAPETERLLCLVNAPANGDVRPIDASEIRSCENRTFALLERFGLTLWRAPNTTVTTTPSDFDRMFPGTGGALYGMASHGWTASFRRPGVKTRVPGLYLAGGSVHPGPGVPMAALSGQMAARSLLWDLASMSLSRRAAMRGGTSTRSATTGATASR